MSEISEFHRLLASYSYQVKSRSAACCPGDFFFATMRLSCNVCTFLERVVSRAEQRMCFSLVLGSLA